ncbi:Sugar (pentulose and hexulose) kinase [Rubrobacter radiotolerans]|uniref:FGGY-family carbohydrate kinase n=1 Tax=Rubrobacter radiotolerans TaxID=42256 RepID=A0A023X6R0_RUBRA|nr:FGGY-family carbohydrate kinase [Rubrobacter radiotolerans]AHY47754.1 Sugar (pentulose and hexulose) kinase [Rubrobacter radiotolerans]MDX5895230.1 FGGY-family carbohydrate kinase [Rubrobacter radiotolerans]SMC07684.1 xylulokinase [Rubrobacter radiotolerans DSM 5868]
MPDRDYVVGIDCSTTATKAVVWDSEGNAVAEGRATFELSSPRPDWGEQNAEDWWESTKVAIRRAAQVVDPRRIAAIGITHQRETFVCLNEDDHPIRPAILWLDSRAKDEVARYGTDEVHRITGKPPNPTPGFYKMLWLREHEPRVLERAAKVADVHAFLVHRMTGEWRTSWATADPLGLVDMESFDWSDELLGTVGLGRENMCELYAPGDVIGELKEDVAREVGLPVGIPVVSGAGDGQAAGLGANITEPGRAYLNLGTGIVSGTYSERYSYANEYRVLSGPVPRTYTLETLLPAGTYTVSWFCDRFAHVDASSFGLALSTEQILETAAAQLGPGAEGLFAVPYLNNALMPYWDFDARGIMVGWTGVHGKAHVYRAILEGIAFEQRLMTEGAETGLEKPVEHMIALGGGSRSSLWCQILADVLKRPVSVAREAESTCLGSGMLAAAACGLHPSIKEAAEAMSGTKAHYEPDGKRSVHYDELYSVYKDLYPSLRSVFPKITKAMKGIAAAPDL